MLSEKDSQRLELIDGVFDHISEAGMRAMRGIVRGVEMRRSFHSAGIVLAKAHKLHVLIEQRKGNVNFNRAMNEENN
jgi:hypothetical protein